MESDCYCPVGLVCWETFQFQTAFCTSILLVACLQLNHLKALIIIHSHLAHHVRNDLQISTVVYRRLAICYEKAFLACLR